MANNRINRYIGAIALSTVLIAVPGCTDTWDDHFNSEASPETTITLWEQIKSNPDYSRFADIVQRAKYYKDNTHAVSDYSYADILNGGQVNTVWVPDNSAFTQEKYEKWLQMLESGDVTDGYNVQQQFLGNHIALWRHNISEPGIDTVKMINGKNLVFDKSELTLQEVRIKEGRTGETYNIPAVNGVMHILEGITPFHYNFYEYLKYNEPQTKFGQYVVSKDTTYFYPSASIEGLPDENGNPSYVDSVYRTSNRLFETTRYLPTDNSDKWQMHDQGFGARINVEDSVFIMLMPTDAAWDAAVQKLTASHIYADTYDDKTKGDLGVTSTAIKDLKGDSLRDMSIAMDIISPLVFNLHKQPKRHGTEMWTLDMFKEYKGDTETPDAKDNYVLNTYGDTLRATDNWKPSDLFNGELVEMSNGIGYEITSWDFPKEYYTPDVEVEIEGTGIFYNKDGGNKYKVGSTSRRYTFSNDNFKEITDRYGRVSNNNFYHLDSPGPTSPPKVEIKLEGNNPDAYVPKAQVMSGKYDVQIVVVPRWYMIALYYPEDFYLKKAVVNPDDETDVQYELTNQLNTDLIQAYAAMNKYKFQVQVSYNNNATTGKDKTTSAVIKEYDGLKVDTITIAEVEFPYSYKNMRYSYPTLALEGKTGSKDAKNGFVYDLVIDKVILKRKD